MREIDLDYFANRLLCWLDPTVLLQSASRIAVNNGNAIPDAPLVFSSRVLSSEQDGGFKELAKEFLERFKIPVETIELVRSISKIPASDAWDQLLKYRFNGSLIIPPPGFIMVPSLPPEYKPLLLIQERDIFIDILMQPLYSLLDMIATAASSCAEIASGGIRPDQVFLQHSSSEPFGAWMDATLAGYNGFPSIADPKIAAKHDGFNRSYRVTTLVGWESLKPAIVQVARELDRATAAETHKPISPFIRKI